MGKALDLGKKPSVYSRPNSFGAGEENQKPQISLIE
jgi:hypothetical protein